MKHDTKNKTYNLFKMNNTIKLKGNQLLTINHKDLIPVAKHVI